MATVLLTVYIAVLLLPVAVCVLAIARFLGRCIKPVRRPDRLATVRQHTERAAYVDQPDRRSNP
jgi:hypothetical protein